MSENLSTFEQFGSLFLHLGAFQLVDVERYDLISERFDSLHGLQLALDFVIQSVCDTPNIFFSVILTIY